MAKSKLGNSVIPWPVFAALNFGLLAAVAVFGFLAFLASLEIVLTLSAPLVAETIESAVRAKYAFITVRNLWLLVGGILFLGLIIFGVNHYFKRWREIRLQRLYLKMLAFEAVIILVQFLLTA